MVDTTPAGPSWPPPPDPYPPEAGGGAPPLRPLTLVPTVSHGGLADADPWFTQAELAPPVQAGSALQILWPFGLRGLSEALEVIALALLMFVLVRGLAQNFVVDGGSMEPSFKSADMVIVNKLAYHSFDLSWLPFVDNDEWYPFGQPEQGDVVVFQFPLSPERDFIKRVVALPGQTVEVRNGQVIVDGRVVDEPYLLEAPAYSYGPETVPEGNVFVLGDARNNSYDSHSWGMLEQRFIIGRAEVRYWPLDRAGTVGHERPVGLAPVEVQQSR